MIMRMLSQNGSCRSTLNKQLAQHCGIRRMLHNSEFTAGICHDASYKHLWQYFDSLQTLVVLQT